jgi:hypothetical protein
MSGQYPFRCFILYILLVLLLPGIMIAGKSPLEITRKIKINKPPAAKAAVEEPATSHREMLGRGYARIGEIWGNAYKYSEKSARKDLLHEANQYGAQVVWITMFENTYISSEYMPERTYITYSSGSDSYMYHGTPATTTTTTIGAHNRNKKVKSVSGYLELFVYDPELAAQQLQEGSKKWTARAAQVADTRYNMLLKIEIMRNKLAQLDASMFNKPAKEYIELLQSAHDVVKTGEFYESFAQSWRKVGQGAFPVGEYLAPIIKDTEETGTFFKDPGNPLRKEIHDLLEDARSYFNTNWEILSDFTTMGLPDQLLF